MTEIRYLYGSVTAPFKLPYILVQVVNDAGRYGAGVSGDIGRRWPQVERSYRAWYAAGAARKFRLGGMLLVNPEAGVHVANIVGQRSVKGDPALEGEAPIRYGAIAEGLASVREVALTKRCPVIMPRIGCGLAGGTWAEVEPVVEAELSAHGVEVYVFDKERSWSRPSGPGP